MKMLYNIKIKKYNFFSTKSHLFLELCVKFYPQILEKKTKTYRANSTNEERIISK